MVGCVLGHCCVEGELYVCITKVTQHIAGLLLTGGKYIGMLLHDAA
jgi:hypothetical protein